MIASRSTARRRSRGALRLPLLAALAAFPPQAAAQEEQPSVDAVLRRLAAEYGTRDRKYAASFARCENEDEVGSGIGHDIDALVAHLQSISPAVVTWQAVQVD